MSDAITLPADCEDHAFCWMAWAVQKQEWGAKTESAQRELAGIIRSISAYENVRLLTPPDCVVEAQRLFIGHDVEIIPAPVDDIWMRDILPTSARRGSARIWIDWNFNGWGGTKDRPGRPGDRVANVVAALTGDPVVRAPFVAEGGAFASNGEGLIVTTQSCLLNENRNPASGRVADARREAIDGALGGLGGCKVIWLEGDPDERITSGHVDGYVLFAADGSVLMESDTGVAIPPGRTRDIATLRSATDCAGQPLTVTLVEPPRAKCGPRGVLAARSYLNAYVANGAVITAKFGDDVRDAAAEKVLRQSFPGHDIRMLPMDALASEGGGVRCLTQPGIFVGSILEPNDFHFNGE